MFRELYGEYAYRCYCVRLTFHSLTYSLVKIIVHFGVRPEIHFVLNESPFGALLHAVVFLNIAQEIILVRCQYHVAFKVVFS